VHDILTTIVVIGAIIILLQVMIIISYWRRGNKYAAMEQVYRQRQAEVNAKEGIRHRLSEWDVEQDESSPDGWADDQLAYSQAMSDEEKADSEDPPKS
jgi:hypothetical protein